MQLLRKNIFQYLLLSTIQLHKKQWDCGISRKWISSFFTHVNWNFPPGQWWVKYFRCWWTLCRQEQASQKWWDLCLAREAGDNQRFQNLEQGEDAAHSLAVPKLTSKASPPLHLRLQKTCWVQKKGCFLLKWLLLWCSCLKPTSAFIYLIAEVLFSLSFYFKHFN